VFLHLLQLLRPHPQLLQQLVQLKDALGMQALHYACSAGFIRAVEQLLALPGIDANMAADDGVGPMHLAAWRGHQGVVQQLSRVPGVIPMATAAAGVTPLLAAI
jgi:ankyrin repeat protein